MINENELFFRCEKSRKCPSLVHYTLLGCILNSVYSSIGNSTYCVCVKRITLCNCLCSSSSPSSRFSASLIRNIEKFGANNYFTDHRTANTIQLFVSIKMKFFGSILFQKKLQQKGIPQRLLDKYSHLFICISLKQTLGNGQKPVYNVKILISKQIALAAVLYFGQVFCRLINKSVMEWFLLIMCK